MLARAFVIALVFIFGTVSAHAANRYGDIKSRLEDKYDDESCSKSSNTPFLKSTRLSCVSCAIEKIAGVRPSTKFLSLLAVHAQRTVNLGTSTNKSGTKVENAHSSQGGVPNDALLKRVIKEVQAYGACTATSGYDQIPTTPIKDLVYRAVSGSTSKLIPIEKDGKVVGHENSVGYSSEEQEGLAKFYGFNKFREINDLFGDDGFNGSTPARRQAGFIERARDGMYNSAESGGELRKCIANVGENRRQNTAFNTNNESANADLCYFMAMECSEYVGEDISFCDNATPVYAPSAPSRPASSSPGTIYREVENPGKAR
ncbi:MAG: hypothetical protein H7326_08000 [Bdellovibrionaceae bacterium]|nr:hypothetical protein [Pseudobdellovibrionaceae bacterium]